MPMPVSRTMKCKPIAAESVGSRLSRSSTSPAAVNLIALFTRFSKIWRMRTGSPMSPSGTSGSMSQASSRPFSCARKASERSDSSTVSGKLKGIGSRSNLPASIFEKSRMSLMTVRSASPDTLTVLTYSRCSASRFVSSRSSVMPMTPFIGVRISWLIDARNSLLARLASSAACCARMRSRKSVMTPTISLSPLVDVTTRTAVPNQNRLPSAAYMRCGRRCASPVASAAAQACMAASRSPGGR